MNKGDRARTTALSMEGMDRSASLLLRVPFVENALSTAEHCSGRALWIR